MEKAQRRTVIAHERLAMHELRLAAARDRRHGLQIMTFEQLAARLSGGLSRPIDNETLRTAIQTSLPKIALGELDSLKVLPGMAGAALDTLRKAWHADIDLSARAASHPRLESIAKLEAAVLAALPPAMMRPMDLVTRALQRLEHAKTLFGSIEIVGMTELSPCWRPLLRALASRVSVRWIAGPRWVPAWLDEPPIEIVRSSPQTPRIQTVSASTTHHEAIEALRWARRLISSGEAEPADIAIAAVNPSDYDDHFLALRADANIDVHFVHGIKVTACREGQAAAALADILMRGLSQTRMRRLAALLASSAGPFQALPAGWTRILPADAPLTSLEAWMRLIDRLTAADWPDMIDHGPALRDLVILLNKNISAAEIVGEALLQGRTLAIWRKALLAGPAASLDFILETLKQDDGLDACVSLSWMTASALAAAPRRFVRLLGLNSSRWPRGIFEDRLLSDHIIPTAVLDPLPAGPADRRDFETILATTVHEIILSRARRDSDGRLLGRSTLLQDQGDETYLRRNGVPVHAFSETDRLTARPHEFHSVPQAISATTCWQNWLSEKITPHDGLVRPDHPLLHAILNRTQSASSLSKLLRNPLGFLWKYGLRLRAPESSDDPLVLDARAMGNLVHKTLDLSLRTLEENGTMLAPTAEQIGAAVDAAIVNVAQQWETEQAIPPHVIWRRTLDETCALSNWALGFRNEQLPDDRAYGEVPFGGAAPKSDAVLPWNPMSNVVIPNTDFCIEGYIDRLDVSVDGRRALVCDYKTGRAPDKNIILDGGKELQRCLYAFAVKAMLGDDISINASLLYLRDKVAFELKDPDATLVDIAGHLSAARVSFLSCGGLIGPDTGGAFDDLAFALPANASVSYCKRKIAASTECLGAAAKIWEAL